MSRSLISVGAVILVVTLASAVYTYFRAGVLASAQQIAARGLTGASRDTAVFYAGVAVVVGVIAFVVFRAMANAAPDAAPGRFLLLAVAIGVVLQIMAAVVFKLRGFIDFGLLHLLHIAGFGWLLPQLMPR
jgi:hypothetical protein